MRKLLLFILLAFFTSFGFAQECSDLFISEYVEGSGNNKAIEIYNPTLDAIDLSAYQLVRYSNGGSEPSPVGLSGTIESKGTFVVVLDKRNPDGIGFEQPVDSVLQEKADIFLCPIYEINKMMYFNGNDAVTLEKTTGEVVDIFALIGPPMTGDDNGWCNFTDTTITYNSGGNPTEYTIEHYNVGPLFWLAWTKDHTLIRKYDVSYGVTENPDLDFIVDQQWDSIPKNTFDSLGFHNCNCSTFSIDENKINASVDIFPNPVSDNNFSINANQAIKSVEMFDITGKVIQRFTISDNSFTGNFSVKENFKGILFVSVKLESGTTKTKKLIFK
ncbi:MAG: T9SS type A sorting domain-containing protein [Chlorobi bacterium]|nr:T9SS type A sorting domain-containing protein [Chlorobiota bacterium]